MKTNETANNRLAAKYSEGLENFRKATGYDWKCSMGAVDFGGYFYILPDKPKIQNSFWFHDEGPNYDAYLVATNSVISRRDYFFKKNLQKFDVEAAREALDKYGVNEYEQNGVKVIDTAWYGIRSGNRPATESEKAAILEALAWCRADFEKRLSAYWKRYGESRMRFDTYWAYR